MSCRSGWEEIARQLEAGSRTAPGQADGALRCNHAGCTQLVLRDKGVCLAGHAQDSAAPAAEAGYPVEIEALLCLGDEGKAAGLLSSWAEEELSDLRVALRRAESGERSYGRMVRSMAAMYEALLNAGVPLDTDPRGQVAGAFLRRQVLPPQEFAQVGKLRVCHCYKDGDPLGWHYQVRDPEVAGDDPLDGWIDFDIRALMRDMGVEPASEVYPDRARHRAVLEQARVSRKLQGLIRRTGWRGRNSWADAPLAADPPAPPQDKPPADPPAEYDGEEVSDEEWDELWAEEEATENQ